MPRRSMNQALQMDEETIAFLEAGKPKPALAKEEKSENLPPPQAKPPLKAVKAEKVKPEKKSEAKATSPEPAAVMAGAQVSMTFRLPPEIPAALVRVSAERKITRTKPYTQQEIVSEALMEWLKKHAHA